MKFIFILILVERLKKQTKGKKTYLEKISRSRILVEKKTEIELNSQFNSQLN